MNPARVHALHVAVMGPASTPVTGHGQTSPGTCRQAVGVAELRAAWHAAAAGRFRTSTPQHLADPGMAPGEDGWSAPGEVVAVLGCHAFAGCTTVAVSLACAVAGPVRVVETAAPRASGLTGYATAELGPTGTGWVRGRRDHVVLDRRHHPGPVPLPDPGPTVAPGALARQLVTVLDAGCHPEGPYADPGWVGPAVVAAQHLVLVTTATVPGMRRLEGVLEHLTPEHRGPVVAVRGPVQRRWPAPVRHSVGPLTRSLLGEVVPVPYDAGLAVHGLDTRPLPRGLLASATDLLHGLGLHDAHPFPTKGSTR
ncbi:hypothetical protein SAMN05421879_10167 [Ornithinimicrobium cerasi]|uniref:MinD-like ATPase involved in chromosome partitioning or flagellar assembly n=2 Tax=Ornithinimicrobium cerasi TaxID=2248773 RepID=A0A285VAP4_9MICO|nr:hypothetical protein SAMN05421879_10167 [Ornithinimicrobium cerasi]